MKRFPQTALRLDEKALTDDLGGKFVFVGSSTDMWAKEVPYEWIQKVLYHVRYMKAVCLFQSKNPARFIDYAFPQDTILGTTIESNRYYPEISKAPAPMERKLALHYLANPVIVSIEPILDFDLDVFTQWIKEIKPKFVSIGADSGNNHLPEPPASKIKALIGELQGITQVKIKDNLKRITG
jgi:hypothetical protein